eukprot:m.342675 g.342675  ORF g.342675 m.342675 type:complete len:251 (-) comp21698_c0_seq1:85-837(-)
MYVFVLCLLSFLCVDVAQQYVTGELESSGTPFRHSHCPAKLSLPLWEVQCMGLHAMSKYENDSKACESWCCGEPTCMLWQYKPPTGRHDNGGGGCFYSSHINHNYPCSNSSTSGNWTGYQMGMYACVESEPSLDGVEDSSKQICQLNFTIGNHSSASCCRGPKPPAQVAAGLYAITAFMVAIILYCGVGMVYQKKQGNTGSDIVPNSGFWMALPGLIGDGFLFTMRPCCRCVNDKTGGRLPKIFTEYDSL